MVGGNRIKYLKYILGFKVCVYVWLLLILNTDQKDLHFCLYKYFRVNNIDLFTALHSKLSIFTIILCFKYKILFFVLSSRASHFFGIKDTLLSFPYPGQRDKVFQVLWFPTILIEKVHTFRIRCVSSRKYVRGHSHALDCIYTRSIV